MSTQCQRLSETGPRRKVRFSEAVLECVRNRSATCSRRKAAARQTWPGPLFAPQPKVEDTPRSDHLFHSAREVDLRYQQDEFHASPAVMSASTSCHCLFDDSYRLRLISGVFRHPQHDSSLVDLAQHSSEGYHSGSAGFRVVWDLNIMRNWVQPGAKYFDLKAV